MKSYPNLLVSRQALEKLRSDLPPGCIGVIVERLRTKGVFYSQDYVRKVLNPDDRRMNMTILYEAIEYCRELQMESRTLERMILNSVRNPETG